jgi:hypothetical protein
MGRNEDERLNKLSSRQFYSRQRPTHSTLNSKLYNQPSNELYTNPSTQHESNSHTLFTFKTKIGEEEGPTVQIQRLSDPHKQDLHLGSNNSVSSLNLIHWTAQNVC